MSTENEHLRRAVGPLRLGRRGSDGRVIERTPREKSLEPSARWLRERAVYYRERAREKADPKKARKFRDIAVVLDEEAKLSEQGRPPGNPPTRI